jgi:hypothetical protein
LKSFALLFFGIFLVYWFTGEYIDKVGSTKVLTTETKADYLGADYSKTDLIRAMRYHGVLSVRENEKGEWYFMREGRQCKVFGELCLLHTVNRERPPQSPVIALRHRSGSSKSKKLTATVVGNPLRDKMS